MVALLGVGVIPTDQPILRADDLGALRGDGIFETMHVRGGQPWLLDEHLARMTRSAARLDISLPKTEHLVELVDQVLAGWPAEVEASVRVVCTRGSEDGIGEATVFATLSAVGDHLRRARREGVKAVTVAQGYPADLRERAPWLLGGAKTLSYAVNMASLRWAQSVGADDVVWISTDGYVLEAPTSTVVWLDGSTACMVPAERTGILAGTTARWLLDHADALGWTTSERMVTPAELCRSDGAWLISSVRGMAPLRTLDDVALSFSAQTSDRVRELLGYA